MRRARQVQRAGGALVAALTVVACVNPAASQAVPARWIAPVDAACIAQAEAFASEVAGVRVNLGPMAFDKGSQLVLGPTVARDPQGRPLDGRQRPGAPEVFELALVGGACVMKHPASGRAVDLPACRCEPLP
jgi:hypothetical protein